jgi:formylglycine-generating enzyme required for sulfatase activity
MSLDVSGATYFRTYDDINDVDGGFATAADGGPIDEADPATVSDFRLDKYLVTVGRFRQFVSAVLPADGGAGWLPAPGSGKHTHLNGGSGLSATGGGFEPGWVEADDGNIDPTDVNLGCGAPSNTWTSSGGTQENLPINCVNWFEAYAFCIWDGGFLPSEAEWEYAAAGGTQQREYPWGAADPGANNQYAIWGRHYSDNPTQIAPVGTAPLGAGLWGQLDLAGEVWEWNLDWYAAYSDPCEDCVNSTQGSYRVYRGGGSLYIGSYLLAPYRDGDPPTDRHSWVGFRCARTP